jgi:DHA1 family tetracycline resistance protein-like MFS transporter
MKKSLLFTMMLAVFLDIANFFMPMPIYTPLFLHSTLLQAHSYEFRSILLGLLVAGYGFSQLIGAPIFGEISDQYGRKKAILLSMFIAIIGCLITGISLEINSISLIFIGRLIIGFASGTVAVVFAIAADHSTEKDRAKNLGYINIGLSLGIVLGPIIGGHLANLKVFSLNPWATPFYCMALFYIINIIFLFKLLPNDLPLRKKDKRIHLFTSFHNLYITIRSSHYLLYLVLMALFFQMGTESFYLAAPIIGVLKFHMSTTTLADYYVLFGIVAALVSWGVNKIVSGMCSDSRKIYLYCIVFYAVTMSSLIFANSHLMFFLPFFSVGLFGVLAWIHINNLFSQSVDESQQGLIFGVSQSLWSLGSMFGTFLVGLTTAIHYQVSATLPLIFIIFSLIAAIAMTRCKPQKR